MLFYSPKLLYPYYNLLHFFPFHFFLSIGWCCGAGVYGLIGCISLSLSLPLTTYFNNNNFFLNRTGPTPLWNWKLSSRNRVTPVSIQDRVQHGITFAALSLIPAAIRSRVVEDWSLGS